VPDEILLDLNDFTLEEVEELEERTGIPVQRINPTALPAKVLSVCVWIVRRRTEPDLTLEEARRTTTLRQLADPTTAPNGKGKGRRPTRATS
jgi:hypothetical protein